MKVKNQQNIFLEKQHSSSKTIPYIINNYGKNVYDQKEVLTEAAKYYKTLYTETVTNETNSNSDIFDELKQYQIVKQSNHES